LIAAVVVDLLPVVVVSGSKLLQAKQSRDLDLAAVVYSTPVIGWVLRYEPFVEDAGCLSWHDYIDSRKHELLVAAEYHSLML
jgi:hypothetical protein